MRTRLAGWGRTAGSLAELVRPLSEDEVLAALSAPAVIARGLGRSYGDAAQVGGGLTLDNSGLDAIGPISPDGLVTLGAGVSIEDLLWRNRTVQLLGLVWAVLLFIGIYA